MKLTKILLLFCINIAFFNISKIKPSIVFEKPIDGGIEFKTIYGTHKITEPLLIDLIESDAIQRLKYIYQGGPSHFVVPYIIYRANIAQGYTRYDHSINCMILAKKKLPRSFTNEEKIIIQAAALLHDISHSLFSHVIDLVKKKENINPINEKAYQDLILSVFLEKYGIKKILEKHNISVEQVLPENNPLYLPIKLNHGEICLDRLEYTISECYLTGFLKKGEISKIIRNINYDIDNAKWYFTDIQLASTFSIAALNLVDLNSGSLWNVILYNLMAKIIKFLINNNLLKEEELEYYKTDVQFWHDLKNGYKSIELIKKTMKFIEEMEKKYDTFEILDSEQTYSNRVIAKFRAVNPNIKINDSSYKKLTDINEEFKNQYLYKKQEIENGRIINFLNPNHPLFGEEIIYGC